MENPDPSVMPVAETVCDRCLLGGNPLVSPERVGEILAELEINGRAFICHVPRWSTSTSCAGRSTSARCPSRSSSPEISTASSSSRYRRRRGGVSVPYVARTGPRTKAVGRGSFFVVVPPAGRDRCEERTWHVRPPL